MKTLSFFISCNPPTATSQMKGAQIVGKHIHFFKKKNVQQAENDLISLLRPHAPKEAFCGPLSVSVRWSLPWRKSEKKVWLAAGARMCDTRPDLDNLAKLICDCMATLGFYRNDSQIAELGLSKRWISTPGIEIKISELEEQP